MTAEYREELSDGTTVVVFGDQSAVDHVKGMAAENERLRRGVEVWRTAHHSACAELTNRIVRLRTVIELGQKMRAAQVEFFKNRDRDVLIGSKKAEAEFDKQARAILDATPAPTETIETYFARQIEWSRNTFGPGRRTKGVIEHIRKELVEVEADPDDLMEWIDIVILAMDGFWRHGGTEDDVLPLLLRKQRKNLARTWPDWRTVSEDKAIEHDRSHDGEGRS